MINIYKLSLAFNKKKITSYIKRRELTKNQERKQIIKKTQGDLQYR